MKGKGVYGNGCRIVLVSTCVLTVLGIPLNAQTKRNGPGKILAQRLVDETLPLHAELDGLELASTPPGKKQCVTIASSDAKDIGEKCDNDEFTAMKTNKAFVEKETENGKEVYDVTIPIHDPEGKIIATAGIDFRPEPGQQQAQVEKVAQQIAKELGEKIKTKEKLFEPAE